MPKHGTIRTFLAIPVRPHNFTGQTAAMRLFITFRKFGEDLIVRQSDDILAEKRIFIMPDILANAGGVTASYFEWVQDRQGYFWKEAVVNEQMETILRDSFEDVIRYAEAHNVNNRIAAYMLAIDRVAITIRQRGIYA